MHARRACIDPHKERKRRSKVRWIDYDLHWDVSCPGGGHLKSLISDQSRNFSWREREKKGNESLTGRAQWLALGGDGKRARRKGYSLEEEGEGGETSNTGECVGRARRGEDER